MRLIRGTPDWTTHHESKNKERNEHSSNAGQVIELTDRGGELLKQINLHKPIMHAKHQKTKPDPISWERLRAIFGNPRPPHTIWEQ